MVYFLWVCAFGFVAWLFAWVCFVCIECFSDGGFCFCGLAVGFFPDVWLAFSVFRVDSLDSMGCGNLLIFDCGVDGFYYYFGD